MTWRWWEQDGIDLEGAKKRAAWTTTISEPDSEEEADVELNGDSGGEEESQGASGLSGAEWSGRMSDQPRQTTSQKHGREGRSSSKNLNLEVQSLVLL